MTVRKITEPSCEPLTLDEMKLHLREDDTAQDALISALIRAAREYAEAYTGRAFVQRTLELSLPCFACEIELPYPPAISIASIKYTDTDGSEQTVAASVYQLDAYRAPARVKPAYGEVWPITRAGDYNAVRIRYDAGYVEIGSPLGSPIEDSYRAAVPELVKQWMRVRVGQLYEHREAVVTGTIVAPLPRDFVDGLLDPLRVAIF